MHLPRLAAMVALALWTPVSLADEDDPFDHAGPPIVGTPVTPVLPTPGTFARAVASRSHFVDCADYSLSGVHIDEYEADGESALTVGCNDSVYDSASTEATVTTPGQRISVGPSGSSSSPDNWRSSSAGATAESNLLGPDNVLNLKAGARANNSRDVEAELGMAVDAWSLEPIGWLRVGSSGFYPNRARLVDEMDGYSSSALARLTDRFVADGTGRLVIEFHADGLYERGGGVPQIMPTGGRVSFAAVLLDPTGLEEFFLGGDDGFVRRWREGTIAATGFALGRDQTDDLYGRNPFPDGEQLLGSEDLRDFVPGGSAVPSADLPNSPTPVDEWLRVALDVVEGREYWLIAGLFVSASGWNSCDTSPGDGSRPNIVGAGFNACGSANGTIVDFTSTVQLSDVIFEGGLRGLQTASGVDYRLAVSSVRPVPLPPALWLMGGGLTVLLAGVRRSRYPGNT